MQFAGATLQVRLARVLRNWNESADPDQHARKRLGDHHAIPAVQNPCLFDRCVEARQRQAGCLSEAHRARLHLVTGAAGAIQGERDSPALIQRTPETEQGTDGIPAARSLDRHEAESLDDPAHVLAVIAVAAHDANAHVAENIRGRDDAGVPKGRNQRPLSQRLLRAWLIGHTHAQGRSQQADEPVSGPDNQRQDDELAEGPAARA